jgi:hypothetical protein
MKNLPDVRNVVLNEFPDNNESLLIKVAEAFLAVQESCGVLTENTLQSVLNIVEIFRGKVSENMPADDVRTVYSTSSSSSLTLSNRCTTTTVLSSNISAPEITSTSSPPPAGKSRPSSKKGSREGSPVKGKKNDYPGVSSPVKIEEVEPEVMPIVPFRRKVKNRIAKSAGSVSVFDFNL